MLSAPFLRAKRVVTIHGPAPADSRIKLQYSSMSSMAVYSCIQFLKTRSLLISVWLSLTYASVSYM